MFRRTGRACGLLLLAFLLPGCLPFAFSPDGKQIAFTYPLSKDLAPLCTMNTDGTGLTVLPEVKAAGLPLWSPDGKTLLFIGIPNDKDSVLFVYDVTARTARKIPFAQHTVQPLAWREDSRQFAVLSEPKGDVEANRAELIRYRASDTAEIERTALSKYDAPTETCLWLPGTDALVWTDSGGNVYRAQAGKVSQLTREGDFRGMALSTDGKRLLLAKEHISANRVRLALYSLDPNSRAVTRLASLTTFVPLPHAALISVDTIRIAPGGKYLAVSVHYRRTGKQPIEIGVATLAKADGSEARQVTTSASQDPPFLMLSWAKDGKQLGVMDYNRKTFTLCKTEDGVRTRALPIP